LALLIVTFPWFVTEWLSSIVTAVPPLTVTEPADVIVMLSGCPFLTVEVSNGVVFAVVTSVAAAGAASAIAAVEASR
jgi:hypothetical protein